MQASAQENNLTSEYNFFFLFPKWIPLQIHKNVESNMNTIA